MIEISTYRENECHFTIKGETIEGWGIGHSSIDKTEDGWETLIHFRKKNEFVFHHVRNHPSFRVPPPVVLKAENQKILIEKLLHAITYNGNEKVNLNEIKTHLNKIEKTWKKHHC